MAKAPRKSEVEFRNRPPQADCPGLPKEAPRVLHLTQLKIGGFQRTSLMIGAFGGLIITSKCLRITKSEIEELATSLVLFPEREAPEIIMLMTDLRLTTLSLNLF